MEREIGATELRQKLTDVMQAVREEKVAYLIETFGRPQAALISMEDYRRFQQFQAEREAFFGWLDETVQENRKKNEGLNEAQVLALIEQARLAAAEDA